MDRSYDEYKDIVNTHLMDFIPNIDNKSISLYEAMKYSLQAGGKRLRPVLLLAACDFAGGDIREALPYGTYEVRESQTNESMLLTWTGETVQVRQNGHSVAITAVNDVEQLSQRRI